MGGAEISRRIPGVDLLRKFNKLLEEHTIVRYYAINIKNGEAHRGAGREL